MIYLLSRPFAFFGIRHPSLRPFLQWTPLVAATVLSLLYSFLPVKPALFGDGSLSRHLITVFAILPGFFIAAIAAVATFQRPELDMVMKAPAPQLKLRTGPDESFVELTQRVFLCHLFAFLTTLSFCAVFLFVSADLLSPSIYYVAGSYTSIVSKEALTVGFEVFYFWVCIWFVVSIVLSTLIGLYFLAEGMHRPNQ